MKEKCPRWLIDAGLYADAEQLSKIDPKGALEMLTEARRRGYNPRPMHQWQEENAECIAKP
jgi:post-segregation antitoxin (ccd killing protein)